MPRPKQKRPVIVRNATKRCEVCGAKLLPVKVSFDEGLAVLLDEGQLVRRTCPSPSSRYERPHYTYDVTEITKPID